jgi:hypothetical protein
MANGAQIQLQINQAIVMLNEICQRVFNAKQVSAHLGSDEDHSKLIALTNSLRDSLDVIGMLADIAAQKIGDTSGNYFHDPIEWVMPPVYPTQRSTGQSSSGTIEGA